MATSNDDVVGSTKASHLCVLVHGLWGKPGHLDSVAAALRDQFPDDELRLLVAKSNSGYFTYDGIETGGERVCLEIEDELAAVAAAGGHIERLSVVGYSLGGLVSRYAIGLLHAKGVLDKLQCMNFTAFASPFLGVRSPHGSVTSKLFNALGSRTLSTSGLQLFGIDTFRDTGRPLLAVLADPDSIFIAGLARFRRRTLYANIVNDRSAAYYTTAIAKTDPYAAAMADPDASDSPLADLPLRFVPGYGDVVLDQSGQHQEGQTPPTRTKTKSRRRRRASKFRQALWTLLAHPGSPEARAILQDAKPLATLFLLLPLGVVLYLANAAYQTVKSSRRRRLHESGLAGIDIRQYRVPLWMKGLRDTVEEAYEEAYEDLTGAQEPEFEESHSGKTKEDLSSSPSPSSPSSPSSSTDSLPARAVHSRAVGDKAKSRRRQPKPSSAASSPPSPSSQLQQGTLALAPEQFAMIDGLNALGFRKYPVWIHNVKHSHAAIVVRQDSPRFDEGRLVLRHFVKEEFLL